MKPERCAEMAVVQEKLFIHSKRLGAICHKLAKSRMSYFRPILQDITHKLAHTGLLLLPFFLRWKNTFYYNQIVIFPTEMSENQKHCPSFCSIFISCCSPHIWPRHPRCAASPAVLRATDGLCSLST